MYFRLCTSQGLIDNLRRVHQARIQMQQSRSEVQSKMKIAVERNSLHGLPFYLISHINHFLELEEIGKVRTVCTKMNQMCLKSNLWERKAKLIGLTCLKNQIYCREVCLYYNDRLKKIVKVLKDIKLNIKSLERFNYQKVLKVIEVNKDKLVVSINSFENEQLEECVEIIKTSKLYYAKKTEVQVSSIFSGFGAVRFIIGGLASQWNAHC